jgi:nitrite reductase/ring-hydroxylating ferredoxin subunit
MTWIKIFDSLKEAEETIPVSRTKLITVGESKICLAHTKAGFYAVADSCPHLGESLSKGTTNYLNEIVCPWHSYRYHLISGSESKNRTRDAKTYKVENREDGIYLEVT